jgi:uncharacterized membrane protein YfcA
MILTYLIIFLTGIGVSFISTLFGLGGGIIMVPILSLILPYSHLEAIATSLATITLVASLNTYNFSKKGVVVWKIVPWIALTSSLFAFISARASLYLPEKILILIFLIFLLWVGLRTFLLSDAKEDRRHTHASKLLPLGIGALSGSLSGLTGIGGGGITTPLTLITGLVRNIQAAPTSNAIMIFTTFFASLSFAFVHTDINEKFALGYIHIDTALLLFLGSAFFSRIGVLINQNFSLFWRKTVLGCLLLFICLRLFLMILD